MPSLSEQLQEVRSQAEVCLYSGGRVVEVRAGVMVMAQLPLPPCSKYHHIAAETMVIENSFGSNRKEVNDICLPGGHRTFSYFGFVLHISVEITVAGWRSDYCNFLFKISPLFSLLLSDTRITAALIDSSEHLGEVWL